MHLQQIAHAGLMDVCRHLPVMTLSQKNGGGEISGVAHIKGGSVLLQNGRGTRGQMEGANATVAFVLLLPTALSFGRREWATIRANEGRGHEGTE